MNDKDIDSILEMIRKIEKPEFDSSRFSTPPVVNTFQQVVDSIIAEIKRVMSDNNLTQEDLCSVSNMSQSNMSKILNGKIIPRIETLNKIASATNTRLVISFEPQEGDE